MGSDSSGVVDGRRARRERSRIAVIDAMFSLIQDGKVPPTVEQVAERAQVSVSSIYRTFDGLDDLQRQAFDQFAVRYEHLLDLAVHDTDERAVRIAALVHSRVALFDQAGALLTIARQRALEQPRVAEGVAATRVRFAVQARECLAPEARALTPRQAANLVAAVDSCTSHEAYTVLSAGHGRTSRQITQTWLRTVSAIVDDWMSEERS